jgi:uncharacterized protein
VRGDDVVREIEAQRVALEALCRRFHVRRLELFGSASGERFDSTSSDLDFLVEFEDLPAGGYADAYFGLAESLKELFRRDIDLVVLSAVKNPYFLESIERSRTLLYSGLSPRSSCTTSVRLPRVSSSSPAGRPSAVERQPSRCWTRPLRTSKAAASAGSRKNTLSGRVAGDPGVRTLRKLYAPPES